MQGFSDVSHVLACPGIDIKEVQEMVECHLQQMIFKNFDPKKADSIFTDSGEVSTEKPGQVMSEKVRSEEVRSGKGQYGTNQVRKGQIMSGEVR